MAAKGSGAKPATAARAAKPTTAKTKSPPAKPKAATPKTAKQASPSLQSTSLHFKPRLIILGGMAGTGKTSIAVLLCKALHAAHVRVDTVEHALLSSLGKDFELKALGYRAAYAIAEDNLRNGLTVVADSVNPWGVTRAAWMRVATRCDVPPTEIEIICSDAEVHEKRLANAKTDEAGVKPPTWAEVMARHYEPWSRDRIVIDTAHQSIEESAAQILASLAS